MKQIVVLLLLLTAGTYVAAQTIDTVKIVQKAKRFRAGEQIRLMYELLDDTLDALGKKTSISRSYYFDKKHRMISSVREYSNQKRPAEGTQVIYTFVRNRLTAVAVIPGKTVCRNCTSEYYYAGDTLLARRENLYTNPDPAFFIRQAHYFQSKLPPFLPLGYFEDEGLIKGRMKR